MKRALTLAALTTLLVGLAPPPAQALDLPFRVCSVNRPTLATTPERIVGIGTVSCLGTSRNWMQTECQVQRRMVTVRFGAYAWKDLSGGVHQRGQKYCAHSVVKWPGRYRVRVRHVIYGPAVKYSGWNQSAAVDVGR